jgi:uncharacterized protein DUF955
MASVLSTTSSMAVQMADPATAALELLAEFDDKYGLGEVPPSPVEEIAGSLLLLDVVEVDDIRAVDGAPQDAGRISSMLTTTNRTIWVDRFESERSQGRRRFTVAHELGHWLLHAQRGDKKHFERFCRAADLDPGADPERQEREANAFAAALLMPEEIISMIAPGCGFNLGLLSAQFDVSVPALELRLTKLKLLPAWMRT